jgi:integrase
MTYIKVRGFKIFTDRLGKPRCYHRASGLAIDLAKFPRGSSEFLAECARIEGLRGRGHDAKPGTLGLLIERYRGHRAFLDLAPRTRSDYHRCLDYLKPLHDTPLARFNAPLVVKIRDKAADQLGRRWGNYVKTVLSVIFAWGHERGFMAANPAFRIKSTPKPRNAIGANRPWTDAERHAVAEALPAHMALPVALMMYCALDPQDALRLPKTAISDGRINTRRGKTAEPVWLPVPEPVAKALAAAPSHDAITLCANSWGRPWTVSGFRASWRPVRLKLLKEGKINPGLTLKGLRHTVATILAEMNCDDRTIADYLGQKTEAMARHYSKRANRTRKLEAVVKNFDREANRRRTKVVKPSG